MYNKNAKQDFILAGCFNTFENHAFEDMMQLYLPIEQELGRDLCTFSQIEHRSVIDILFAKEDIAAGKWIGYYMIRRYLKWCLEHGIDDAVDSLDGYLPKNISSFRTEYVDGPEELRNRMDIVLSAEDRVEPDITIRAFLWLLFMGIPENDAYQIEEKDVDLVNLRVNVREKSFPIHPLALSTIVRVTQSKTFLLVHTNYTATVDRFDSKLILRNRRSNPTYRTVRTLLMRALKSADMKGRELSPYYTFKSGYFYRAWQGEKMGIASNFSSFFLIKQCKTDAQTMRINCQVMTGEYCKWKLANNLITP